MGLVVDRPDVPGETRWYTPMAYGNREDMQPTRVLLRNPSEAEKRRLYRDLEVTDDGTVVTRRTDDGWVRDALCLAVIEVQNYTGPGGKPITTAEELFENGHTKVSYEIATEVITAVSLSEDDAGKSGAHSVSTPAATRPSTGTVVNAELVASTDCADASGESGQSRDGNA